MVLVNSSLGENVGGIYRHFRRNNSAFPAEALDALTAAVSLSAANQQPHRTHQPTRGRGYSSGFNQRSSFRQPRWRGSRVPFSRDHVALFLLRRTIRQHAIMSVENLTEGDQTRQNTQEEDIVS